MNVCTSIKLCNFNLLTEIIRQQNKIASDLLSHHKNFIGFIASVELLLLLGVFSWWTLGNQGVRLLGHHDFTFLVKNLKL